MGRRLNRCPAGACGFRSRRLRSGCSIGVAIPTSRGGSPSPSQDARTAAEERDRAARERDLELRLKQAAPSSPTASTPPQPSKPRGLSTTACSGFWKSQVLADFQDKKVIHFAVARHCAASIQLRLMPPGVIATLPQQFTTMKAEMAQQIPAFHKVRANSS